MSHGILRLSPMNRSIIFGPFSALILTCVFGFRLLHMSRSKFGPTHKLFFDQFLKGKCFIRKDWKKEYKHAYSFNERNHYTKRIYRKNIYYNSVASLYHSMTNVLGSSSIWTCRILNFAFRIFVVVFYRQVQLKKSKQTLEIQHVQINEVPRTIETKFRTSTFFKY